ncbi:hypothetical protein [Mycolicibacterium austroafricanum]|uniref:hypothetical protein n=1 Tax=Mycolicibacterium austroafricanum TaxID=39687 RepID=UPI001CA345B3|nr:hypothetical protein [Mycolicibacterium austroafricanum]QZT61828.1 hypothetical protein JN085_23260 [Mycolicibacterium austroafricanum]
MQPAVRRPSPDSWLLASRAFAIATLGVVVALFCTAGVLVQSHQLKDTHGAAAIALHVATAGLTLALGGLAFSRERGWWAAGVAGVLFAFTFVQAYLGEGTTLAIHIPGALAVVAATVWLTAWVFSVAPAAIPATP